MIDKMKNCKKRNVIINALRKANKPITAEELYNIVSKEIEINLSTIYRSLNTLVNNNLSKKDIHQDGLTYYVLNDHTHKHYLICEKCNEIINIKNCPINTLENDIESQTGFDITNHILEFRGICPKCKNK